MIPHIDDCSVEIHSDGTITYQATVDNPGDQVQGRVEWYIDGQLAARDGPLSLVGGQNNFEQPRENGFTEEGLLVYETDQDVRLDIGEGEFPVDAALFTEAPTHDRAIR